MFRVFILSDEKGQAKRLVPELATRDFVCSIDPDLKKASDHIARHPLDLIFVTINGAPDNSALLSLTRSIKEEASLPVIALLSREALNKFDVSPLFDDFIVEPWDAMELATRAKRILGKKKVTSSELMECGDLTIDSAKCEVSVAGRLVTLTFKEFELLRFLANNPGRVFSREALLNEVWGYDYYGGDRTVDVHIRRLRSKLEDPTHTFVETVRNIGYKFKENA